MAPDVRGKLSLQKDTNACVRSRGTRHGSFLAIGLAKVVLARAKIVSRITKIIFASTEIILVAIDLDLVTIKFDLVAIDLDLVAIDFVLVAIEIDLIVTKIVFAWTEIVIEDCRNNFQPDKNDFEHFYFVAELKWNLNRSVPNSECS